MIMLNGDFPISKSKTAQTTDLTIPYAPKSIVIWTEGWGIFPCVFTNLTNSIDLACMSACHTIVQ